MYNEFKNLPLAWPDETIDEIRGCNQDLETTMVVLDDDPTGTQTVHDVSILTTWDVETLEAELNKKPSLFYILTNSRSLVKSQAISLATTLGKNLREASQRSARSIRIISRGDSTLRGHYPAEVISISAALGMEDKSHVLIPAFFQGGRYTLNDIHYATENNRLIPVGETVFALDSSFGFRSSDLKKWVEEKSQGRINSGQVYSITLDQIRLGGPEKIRDQLIELKDPVCIVNAIEEKDLSVVALAILEAEKRGKTFVFRTAASIVPILAGMTAKPLLSAANLPLKANRGGLMVVGSYVPKSTAQLEKLLSECNIEPIEIPVKRLLSENRHEKILSEIVSNCDELILSNKDVVLYTSRKIQKGDTSEQSLEIINRVSHMIQKIIGGLKSHPRYILAKGGITSSDIATKAIGIKRALVLGQILPGVPVWKLNYRGQNLVYIVFPGNVGDEYALSQVCAALKM